MQQFFSFFFLSKMIELLTFSKTLPLRTKHHHQTKATNVPRERIKTKETTKSYNSIKNKQLQLSRRNET